MAVTPDEIAVEVGRSAPDPDSVLWRQWTQWINDANMLIDARMRQLKVVVVDETTRDYVVRQAVAAQVKRPDDATQVTISVDDGQTSKSYRSGKGRVTIIDDWWTLLGLTDPSGAFAFDMTSPRSAHLPWCSLAFGAAYCSCGTDIAGEPIYEGAL